MNVWVVKTSEMLASDNGNGRLLRSGLVAHMLDGRGHRVVWWMSTFDHANRRSRAPHDSSLSFGARGAIRMLHSPGYSESVSLARVRDHALWGRAFRRAIETAPLPDIIFCAYPTLEAAAACVRFGQRHGVPVVVDLRDMWPDIFTEWAPAALKPAARRLLWPWRARARAALRGATALFAITEEFLNWGLQLAGRERCAWDEAFLLAYPEPAAESAAPGAATEASAFWDGLGVSDEHGFNVVFVGSLTRRRLEVDTVLAAARDLQRDAGPVRFILAGDGDDLPRCRMQAQDCSNVLFPGWLSAVQIRELLRRAHLGLVPYRKTPDLVMSIPNKVGEYFAAGVPVATCLQGTLARLLGTRRCGLLFDASEPASLAALVRRLRADERQRLALSANARRVYREELTAEVVYGRLIERLERIAAAGRQGVEVDADRIRVST